jgi:ATP-binding cassette subfamily B protein
LVGPSGAGKSTILNLVIGFIRPSQGKILIDGQDMEKIDLRSYRQYLSIVPQETILFDGTIRENITYGLGCVPDDEVLKALQGANALEFVDQLPSKLDALVGERGSMLSGGQKQRLAIARALIRDPRVLVLDEATSSLDSKSEFEVQKALENLLAGRTTFVAAHRLSTIMNADRIIVLDQGKINGEGTHAELIDQNDLYKNLYQTQVNA